jgi:hypothetical protein
MTRPLLAALALVLGCGNVPSPQSSASGPGPGDGSLAADAGSVAEAPAPTAGESAAGQGADVERKPDVSAGIVRPQPFAGRETVALSELLDELERIAREMEVSDVVRADFAELSRRFGLADDEATYRDYVRVKLVFEATRDSGFWYVTWTITAQLPQSDEIWSQWASAAVPDPGGPAAVTAWAECDELSALFAFLARGLGVDRIGLYWPGGKHTVAVWQAARAGGGLAPIVVPTSQIYLDPAQSLGTTSFKVGQKRKIYTYKRRDVRPDHELPAGLARFFVEQARRYASLPQTELQKMRNARSSALGGS